MTLLIPAEFAISCRVKGGLLRQLRRPAKVGEFDVEPYARRRTQGHLVTNDGGPATLVVTRTISPPADVQKVLLSTDGGINALLVPSLGPSLPPRWLKPTAAGIGEEDPADSHRRCSDVCGSWRGQFTFSEECREDGGAAFGLRPPQIGALHAAIAHWRVTDAPATIVMPTGTGKTETMLALLVCERLARPLVVVPTAALRDQISMKFVTLGILKQRGVVGEGALYPLVGSLEHRPQSPAEVDAFFDRCNVVVTTMNVIGGCDEAVQARMVQCCSNLFIDEAHHASAPTWDAFRRQFLGKPILQFTATPFRGDGRHVDGKTIFNYPLRKAQEEGYFKPINFRPVMEFRLNFADRTIALSAIAQLQRDLDDGFDHIVMARASDIVRAEMVHAIYRELADSFNPLLIHSRLGEEERRTALRSLCDRSTRIIVCVDMLGEGFDLPELKIAALHDMHKSLAVTLQFIGRFTRTKENIGEASVIANIADARVEESLQELYAEDADWNFLLRGLSEGATGRQERRSEFLENFTDVPAEIPLQNVLPKMSTVVFRTNCVNWRPENVHMAVEDDRLYAGPSVNHESRVLLFVTRELEPIPWGIVKGIENTTWDLYLVHWWPEKQLLFINSSNNASLHEDLAKAIVGDDIELFRGERVFRALHGVNRLILMNLGLNHSLSRAVRFTMYVGADIHEGLSEAHLQNKIKSNIFGRGYEGGGKATIGCSYKGRVWSYRVAGDISEWVDWCHRVGDKLLDEMISVEEILRHVMKPRQIGERPALAPLTIEWSEAFLQRSEEMIRVDVDGDVVPFYEAGLEMNRPDRKGPLRFRVFTESKSAEYEVKFTKSGVEYVPTEGAGVEFLLSRKRRSLTEWFQIEPPVIRFEDGSFLIYNEFFELPRGDREPFDRERIVAWDWAGTNLKVESQTIHRHADSIQYRVIQTLLSPSHDPHYDLVFDDDDAHEAADIVAMKVAGERLLVHFFHCKYSKEPGPGARVDDLYAVCGQAQRSVFWKGDVGNLFEHLRLRDASRLKRHSVSRFDLGDMAKLMEISRRARYLIPDFKIFVVQPGLSKQQADTNQLELLAVTELYLKETYAIAFEVIASA